MLSAASCANEGRRKRRLYRCGHGSRVRHGGRGALPPGRKRFSKSGFSSALFKIASFSLTAATLASSLVDRTVAVWKGTLIFANHRLSQPISADERRLAFQRSHFRSDAAELGRLRARLDARRESSEAGRIRLASEPTYSGAERRNLESES